LRWKIEGYLIPPIIESLGTKYSGRTARREQLPTWAYESPCRDEAIACGWKRLADANRDEFSKHLQGRKDLGIAPRTLNNVVTITRGFCEWAVSSKRIDDTPIQHIKRFDQTADRRRKRRALMPDEMKRLLTKAGPRELVYRVAAGTGLRRRELRRLQWRDVVIDDTVRPCLVLRAEATKSKRADTIPLFPDLADRLKAVRSREYKGTNAVVPHAPDLRDVGCRLEAGRDSVRSRRRHYRRVSFPPSDLHF
jgi:integrase